MVCGWGQFLECGQRLTKILSCGKLLRKCVRLQFLPVNIYDHTAADDHTAAVVPILPLQLTAQIQKLKYKVK